MDWDAVGAIGEIVGAVAVVLTLVVLIFQVRNSNRTMQESNRLERAKAIDRHADTVSVWRGRLTENAELAQIWTKVHNNSVLSEEELLRANNLFIEFTNTQRSNFLRARTVGESGLMDQAVRSLATEASQSETTRVLWSASRPWTALASEEFVQAVEDEIKRIEKEGMGDMTSLPPALLEKARNSKPEHGS
jgi:hypothetical protein